jgi:hypothetical protein
MITLDAVSDFAHTSVRPCANHVGMARRVVEGRTFAHPTELRCGYAAAADLPIAAFTRGMTSSAINCMERLLSAGSTQSIPA